MGVTGHFEEERDEGNKAIALARRHSDIARLMSALITTAWGCLNSGDYHQSIAHLEEAIALGQKVGEGRVVAICRATMLFPLLLQGRIEDTRRAAEIALNACDERVGLWAIAFTRGSVGIISVALGDIERARQFLPEVTLNFHAISTRWEVACLLSECAHLSTVLGEYERGALLYGAAEALRQRSGHVDVPAPFL